MSYRGHQRIVAIGPRAQAVLRPWLRLNVHEYLFSPQETLRQLRAQQRRNRKTKVQPSQVDRRKKNPARKPGDRYTVASYAYAIARACDKVDRKVHEDDTTIPAAEVIVPRWHPHQLRHNAATLIQNEFGIDFARATLGHKSPSITEVYVERDQTISQQVMAKLG